MLYLACGVCFIRMISLKFSLFGIHMYVCVRFHKSKLTGNWSNCFINNKVMLQIVL